jgi:hypothetical protein
MCLLVSWCVGGKCDMASDDEDRGRSWRLGAEDRGWSGTSRVLSGRTIRRSGDAVCDPHHTRGGDEKHGFPGLASKPVATVWPQNHCDSFFVWASKLRLTVWWLGPQNHCDGFLVCASKLSGRRFVCLRLKTIERMKTVWEHASTSGGLLRHEASWARVF